MDAARNSNIEKPLHTDKHGRIWSVIERPNGTVSAFYRLAGSQTHYVVYDDASDLATTTPTAPTQLDTILAPRENFI